MLFEQDTLDRVEIDERRGHTLIDAAIDLFPDIDGLSSCILDRTDDRQRFLSLIQLLQDPLACVRPSEYLAQETDPQESYFR